MPLSARGVSSTQQQRGLGRGRGATSTRSRPYGRLSSRPITSAFHRSVSASVSASSRRTSSHWESGHRARRVSPTTRREPSESIPPAVLTTGGPPTRRQHGPGDDLNEADEHVIMAIDYKDRGTIGCAYYMASEERLFCMEDLLKGDRDAVDKLRLDIQATHVLVSTRADAKLDLAGVPDRDSNALHSLAYERELRPNPEYSYEDALTKLANLDSVRSDRSVRFLVPGDDDDFNDNIRPDELGLTERQGNLLQILASLDLDSKVSIGCVGALIACLHRKRASEYLQNDPDGQAVYRISTVTMFSYRNTMFVNADTLSSLQIIMPETHPNIFNQGPGTTGSKESLSVFGLFYNHARTPQGRAQLRQMFLRPSLDTELIDARQQFVSVFVRPDNQTTTERLSKSLSKIKNLRSTMAMLRRGIEARKEHGSFKSGIWATLLEFCYYAIEIVDALHEVIGSQDLLLCIKLTETLDKFKLKHIGKIIFDVVDLELSQEQHRTVVKHGIDDNLDKVKDVYDGMEELLSRVAVDVARGMPLDLNCRINVIFFPQLGFHITVPLNEASLQPLWNGNGVWELMFTTKNTAYFKEEKTRRMDRELGDLWASICDVEIEIVHGLAQQVLEDQDMLVASSDILGELDSLLALAHGAMEHKLVKPRIVENNLVEITGGRHILQEMVVPSYVPNDTALRGGDGDDGDYHDVPVITILTGPNFSGKSVYQNHVAIIAYMAQVGCFVPAERCTLGITDKILTRISTTETVSKTHSAFMLDLQQIGLALNSCTNRSLVIIDEFGKGTDTCDGAGLAAGVLQHLLELGTDCPKVLAATHFHEIFELGLFIDEPRLRLAHMQVRVDKSNKGKRKQGETAEEVTYLYQMAPGRSLLSYGVQCAAMNGVPAPVVERAVELAECHVKGHDLVTLCSNLGHNEMQDLILAESTCRRFLNEDFDEELVDKGEGPRELLEAILNEVEGELLSSDATMTELSTGVGERRVD